MRAAHRVAASSEILEEIMQAVARSSSQEILETDRSADRRRPEPGALRAGSWCAFCGTPSLRKLRAATVPCCRFPLTSAIAWLGSPKCSPKKTWRGILQIMLRTHAELGYRQEQRFHLELGLLKLAHAQRLLPLEQLLSGVEPAKTNAPDRKLSLAQESKTEPRTTNEPAAAAARPFVSPFAADTARKGTPRMEAVPEPSGPSRQAPVLVSTPQVVMGSAAPAVAREPQLEATQAQPKASANTDVRSLRGVECAGFSRTDHAFVHVGGRRVEGRGQRADN